MKEINIDEVDITHAFIFTQIMLNEHLCRRLLEAIIDDPIGQIDIIVREKDIKNGILNKGIRLDVYIEDEQKTVYNLEMQRSNEYNLDKRTRYYQGSIDMELIKQGEDYNKLKKTYIIFICLFDPYNRGRRKYTWKTTCVEEPDLILQDEVTKIYLNADSILDDDCKDDLIDFLNYVKDRTNRDNEFAQLLEKELNNIKQNKKVRRDFMTLEYEFKVREKIGEKKGEKIGEKKGEKNKAKDCAKKLILKGMDNYFIMDTTGLSWEEIEDLRIKIVKF